MLRHLPVNKALTRVLINQESAYTYYYIKLKVCIVLLFMYCFILFCLFFFLANLGLFYVVSNNLGSFMQSVIIWALDSMTQWRSSPTNCKRTLFGFRNILGCISLFVPSSFYFVCFIVGFLGLLLKVNVVVWYFG